MAIRVERVENSRQWTGLYASSPPGWVGGIPYAAWIQRKIREAKRHYRFSPVRRTPGYCRRHGTRLTRMDERGRDRYGCETCFDELASMFYGWGLEFVRCRTLTPPVGALTSYGTFARETAICGNRECRRAFVMKHPSHRYCCEKCYQKAKWLREKARRKSA